MSAAGLEEFSKRDYELDTNLLTRFLRDFRVSARSAGDKTLDDGCVVGSRRYQRCLAEIVARLPGGAA